jgi:hypothetical protein
MLKLAPLALLLMSLSACGQAPSRITADPHVKDYSKDTLEAAADEIDALPDGSVLANIMIPDYAAIRAGARECAKWDRPPPFKWAASGPAWRCRSRRR